MALTEQEQISYLANIILLAHADASLSPRESAAIEEIRARIGARKPTLSQAMKAVQSGAYSPTRVGKFHDQVSNLADMLYVCFVDGDLDEREAAAVREFCSLTSITREQFDMMMEEAIGQAESAALSLKCPSCSQELEKAGKFCPNCGAPLAQDAAEPVALDFQIPATGYAAEFCESSAGGFPAALEVAKTAPHFTTCIRGKKTWYLAAWPDDGFSDMVKLARSLSGIRNRKVYHNGAELPWDVLFGFLWCARNRESAYRPVEYCFGKDENRLNPWGCKQLRMDWTEWAQWFSYGQFKRGGFFGGGGHRWVFDKARIRHELMANLHNVRYCPYLREKLVDAVLRALPDEVEVSSKGAWRYSRGFEEAPGSIKIVEVERAGGFEYKSEYFADGVRPKGIEVLEEVLRKAFVEAGVSDLTPTQLTR